MATFQTPKTLKSSWDTDFEELKTFRVTLYQFSSQPVPATYHFYIGVDFFLDFLLSFWTLTTYLSIFLELAAARRRRYRARSEKFHSRSVADRVSGYEYPIRKRKGGNISGSHFSSRGISTFHAFSIWFCVFHMTAAGIGSGTLEGCANLLFNILTIYKSWNLEWIRHSSRFYIWIWFFGYLIYRFHWSGAGF